MNNFYSNMYNPDVLSCLANLSNDEVFTPPEIVNKMLDMLPKELWHDKNATFLDPSCKSGVFLREIAKRLLEGLKYEIPDLQERIDHIFHKQIYGIAITELTSLLSRRSVYCSKYPNSKYSITLFDNVSGNIRYKRKNHRWEKGKCKFCGASKSEYERGKDLESHAYEWIHTLNPREIFKMKFDVIIGNPPYQMSTGGSLDMQATPIYHEFIKQAKMLKPKFISMIIPSRWMNGGFALDAFRDEMLDDTSIKILHDYLSSDECFAGINLTGGVCYFLWERDYVGKCQIFTHEGKNKITESIRYLREEGCSTYIRFSQAISILKKVRRKRELSFSSIVSQRDPYGLNYYEGKTERMFKPKYFSEFNNSVKVYYFGWQNNGIGYVDRNKITTRIETLDNYKIFISKANGAASKQIPYSVISKPFIGYPNECCNMTYLCIGNFNSLENAYNCQTYISSKFFRFLVSLKKNTQNALKKVYEFVPIQDFSKPWTDEELYAKYSLTDEEISFIESMIKPMEIGGDENDK